MCVEVFAALRAQCLLQAAPTHAQAVEVGIDTAIPHTAQLQLQLDVEHAVGLRIWQSEVQERAVVRPSAYARPAADANSHEGGPLIAGIWVQHTRRIQTNSP